MLKRYYGITSKLNVVVLHVVDTNAPAVAPDSRLAMGAAVDYNNKTGIPAGNLVTLIVDDAELYRVIREATNALNTPY